MKQKEKIAVLVLKAAISVVVATCLFAIGPLGKKPVLVAVNGEKIPVVVLLIRGG